MQNDTDYSLELMICHNVQNTAEGIQHASIIKIHQFAGMYRPSGFMWSPESFTNRL